MSEFSDSYHIRATDFERVSQQLKSAGFPGLVFPPANGWIVYVPFAEGASYKRIAAGSPGGFGAVLSGTTASDVLRYIYAEDHLWAFALYRDGAHLGGYACAWDPEFSIQHEIDIALLQPYCSHGIRPDDWRRILEPASYADVLEDKVPQRFADRLGLSNFDWISPHYAQIDPQSFKDNGAIQVGRRPASTDEKIKKPRFRSIELPRPNPTAKETFDALVPLIAAWDSTYVPRAIFLRRGKSSGFAGMPIGSDGRATVHGAWTISFTSKERRSYVHVSVAASGQIDDIKAGPLVRALRLDGSVIEDPVVPSTWLDSPEILAAAAKHRYVRDHKDYPPLYAIGADLTPWATDEKIWWRVRYIYRMPKDVFSAIEVELFIDPETGAFLRDRRSRSFQGQTSDWP